MANIKLGTMLVICPACGYLVDVLKDKTIITMRSDRDDEQKCKNCKQIVAWSIYEGRVFPYIKGKKYADYLCETLAQSINQLAIKK